MNKIVCDRCGHEDTLTSFRLMVEARLWNIKASRFRENSQSLGPEMLAKDMDICLECRNELKDWLGIK